MANYLDESGLTQLWSKIKAYVQQHSQTAGLIVVEKVVDNISVNGNAYTDGSISATESGKTCIGVVGYSITNATSSGSNGGNCAMAHAYLDGDTLRVRVRNTASAAAKVKVTLKVLYTEV